MRCTVEQLIRLIHVEEVIGTHDSRSKQCQERSWNSLDVLAEHLRGQGETVDVGNCKSRVSHLGQIPNRTHDALLFPIIDRPRITTRNRPNPPSGLCPVVNAHSHSRYKHTYSISGAAKSPPIPHSALAAAHVGLILRQVIAAAPMISRRMAGMQIPMYVKKNTATPDEFSGSWHE